MVLRGGRGGGGGGWGGGGGGGGGGGDRGHRIRHLQTPGVSPGTHRKADTPKDGWEADRD